MVFKSTGHTQQRYLLTHFITATVLALVVLLTACGNGSSGTTTTSGPVCPATKSLTGAGSTFDNPLFSKMFSVYPSAKCGANVNYQSVGSGAGINDLLNGIVQFGATDTPMTDAQLAQSTKGPILHVPV